MAASAAHDITFLLSLTVHGPDVCYHCRSADWLCGVESMYVCVGGGGSKVWCVGGVSTSVIVY